MIKRFILGILMVCAFTSTAHAAAHSLGFAAGSTYGVGLSYSHDNEVWGIQGTALPVWDADSGGMIAAGVNVKRSLHNNGHLGVYTSLGVAGMLTRGIEEECYWNEKRGVIAVRRSETNRKNIAFGPGVGFEVLFWKNMLFRFELPIAVHYGTDSFGVTPIPNVALMYRWKISEID